MSNSFDQIADKKNVPTRGYKYLILLAMLYLTADLASCALNYKFVKIDYVFFSAETLIFPFTYMITDIIAEVYGYKLTRKIVWMVFLCDFLFALSTMLLVKIPSPSVELQNTYNYVFGDLL